MIELLCFAHVSVIEDVFYILFDEHVEVKSYKPHYVKVYANVADPSHKQQLLEKLEGYVIYTKGECDEMYAKDKLT